MRARLGAASQERCERTDHDKVHCIEQEEDKGAVEVHQERDPRECRSNHKGICRVPAWYNPRCLPLKNSERSNTRCDGRNDLGGCEKREEVGIHVRQQRPDEMR